MKSLFILTLLFSLFSVSLQAQDRPDPQVPQGENLKVPEGWEIRLDKAMDNLVVSDNPDEGDIYFVNMTPGWHLTTGPRGIFWHPANNVEGDFGIKANLYLFNTNGRNREGYGLFFGGQNLQEDDQNYIYFLLRNTGEFLIKERVGSETKLVQDWTKSEHIVLYTEDMGDENTAENNLQVKIEGAEMVFVINGEEVSRLDKGNLNTNGHFGLRVNHRVNLHISDLGEITN